jgi:acetolactate synthase-1/2/3 large subunit
MGEVADRIVGRLREVGVRSVFGVPGGGANLDLIDACGREGLPFVLTATEAGGALAAVAQAEVTGSPGACLATLGPGAASLVNGVACAFLDRAPILAFTDTWAASGAQYEHQHLNQRAIFDKITKWSGRLAPDRIDETIEQAFASVLTLPPGPVHVDCPPDFESRNRAASSVRRGQSRTFVPDESDTLERLLAESRSPLAVVGLGARRPQDAAAIRGFCERRAVPALVTYKAKGVVPDDHPWFAGVFTNGALERPIVEQSDLLIGIGLDPVELLPRPWAAKAPVIACGRWRVSDGHVPFAVQLVSDDLSGLTEIERQLRATNWKNEKVRAHAQSTRERVMAAGHGFTARQVVQVAARRLAPQVRVAVDAGAHMLPVTTLWPVAEPNGMLISNGLSTMGFALPAAIGASLVDRDRRAVALTGDGGLLMCVGELLTAAREQLRIIVLVFADASLSLIDIKQRARGLTRAGVALGAADWSQIARGFGVEGHIATDDASLDAAIDRALAAKGPSLIEARIDPSNYQQTMDVIRGGTA